MHATIAAGTPNHQYVTLVGAFDFFNDRIFCGTLPAVIITFQRQANTRGYYSPKRFEGRQDARKETDELALNPGTFLGRTDAEILSTLVHEMVHHWQEYFGKPSRGRYHNKEWADRMEQVGLMPSDTGEPGGKRVGQQMTHYVIAGGAFDVACKELLADGVRLEWQSRENPPKAKAKSSKVKFTCAGCGQNAWAKPGANLMCGECEERMESEEGDDEN